MQRILLVCRISESVGIGHLSRIVRVAKALKANNFIELRIVVIGANIQRDYLLDFDHKFYTDSFSIEEAMIIEVGNYQPTTIVFDLYSDNINYSKLLHAFKQKNIKLVAIDGFIEYCQLLDLIWIPSFRSPEFNNECIDRLRFGWDRFLLGRRNKISHSSKRFRKPMKRLI